ncbi:MAG: hypothetical protein ACON4C_10190 [Henriciella sp.]|jgi:hypothetical protein
MADLITPQTLNYILALIAAEALTGLWVLTRWKRLHLIVPFCLFLFSGTMLMLALRLALPATPAPAHLVGLCLIGALLSHLAFLAILWRMRPAG